MVRLGVPRFPGSDLVRFQLLAGIIRLWLKGIPGVGTKYVSMGRLNGTGIHTASILGYHNCKFYVVRVLESLGIRK